VASAATDQRPAEPKSLLRANLLKGRDAELRDYRKPFSLPRRPGRQRTVSIVHWRPESRTAHVEA
jgi:hypothetical protein